MATGGSSRGGTGANAGAAVRMIGMPPGYGAATGTCGRRVGARQGLPMYSVYGIYPAELSECMVAEFPSCRDASLGHLGRGALGAETPPSPRDSFTSSMAIQLALWWALTKRCSHPCKLVQISHKIGTTSYRTQSWPALSIVNDQWEARPMQTLCAQFLQGSTLCHDLPRVAGRCTRRALSKGSTNPTCAYQAYFQAKRKLRIMQLHRTKMTREAST